MRWFTSDLHLGDPWTTKMRYCKDDIQKHDDWLAARWDAKIAADDEVWLLGDIAPGRSDEYVDEWLSARPGRKRLVLGNHDATRDFESWPVGNAELHPWITLESGIKVAMCHYPKCAHGGQVESIRLHGHTHKRQKSSWEDGILRIHVGWDAWRRAIPEPDIISLIEKELLEREEHADRV